MAFSTRTLVYRFCPAILLLCATAALSAEDAFYEIPVDELTITEGELPEIPPEYNWRHRRRARQMISRVVLDGPGEAYPGRELGLQHHFQPRLRSDQPDHNTRAIAVRAPEGKPVTGSLYLYHSEKSHMVRLRFEVPPSKATKAAEEKFYLTRADYYDGLLELQIPGAAWFRHQKGEALRELGKKTPEEPIEAARQPDRFRQREDHLQNTFQVFSGGRAISENLQLDRVLRATAPDESSVDITTLEGITVAEMDWSELTKDIDPPLDPLAKNIPHDQHVLFFASFDALMTMIDEATNYGTPVLHALQPRAENARSQERYEKQLCLSTDALSRLLGPQVIASVAVTGSDPYLRTGTDVALLFEAKKPDVLNEYMAAKHRAALQQQPDCRQVAGKIGEVAYAGLVSPDRPICSYTCTLGDAVVVTNSLRQLERLIETEAGKVPAIASLPEYRFFRERYRRDDPAENGLLIVTDAAIRRWCGPRWRIGTSRRTRAAAVMSHHQAAILPELAAGKVDSRLLTTKLHVPDLGTLQATGKGVTSSTYGSLDFLTPIAELELSHITQAEAAAYKQWRNRYQNYWRQFFDPIAVRFSVREERLAADVTVMPLIEGSDYREFVQITSGVSIKPDAGDRHSGSLLQWAMAVNIDSEPLRWTSNFLQGFMPGAKGNPLGWMGESIAVYIDEDPFLQELVEADDPEKKLEKEFHRFPVAFQADVSSSLKLAAFLSGVRAFVEGSAPGLVHWEILKHNEQPYVKISPTGDDDPLDLPEEFAIYYAATPRALIVTLNERVLKNALDRQSTEKSETPEIKSAEDTAVRPWLGSSMALQVDARLIRSLELMYADSYRGMIQAQSWSNIPILNEWKQRFPDRDPLGLHQQAWQTKLVCPGGGEYIWNKEFQTMESTVFGHPGAPRRGPKSILPLKNAEFLNFGLTFENDGLRAKVEIDRSATK